MAKTLTFKLEQTHNLIESVGGLRILLLLGLGSLSTRHLLNDFLFNKASISLRGWARRNVARVAVAEGEESPTLTHVLHLVLHLSIHMPHEPAIELGRFTADPVAFLKALLG